MSFFCFAFLFNSHFLSTIAFVDDETEEFDETEDVVKSVISMWQKVCVLR